MKHHEREFFISMIRSGKLTIRKDNIKLIIMPLTIDQLFESCEIYQDAYNRLLSEEIMTEEDIDVWMRENGIWTPYDDMVEKKLNKEIEDLKVEIYNARNEQNKAKRIRIGIREQEWKLSHHLNKKYVYHQNTCEGLAASERLVWIIKNITYSNNCLYDFEDISMQYVVDEWQSHFLSESKCRELARTDPWKSIWITRENSGVSLFSNPPNTELTHNQKNLLIWSQMYDNIQESLDCPNKEVIEDDDMLDGWFIIQSRKREKEKTDRDFEASTNNSKIKNSSEVFVMAGDKNHVEKINNMNDVVTKNLKKQREKTIEKYGAVLEQELPDKKIEMQVLSNQQKINR